MSKNVQDLILEAVESGAKKTDELAKAVGVLTAQGGWFSKRLDKFEELPDRVTKLEIAFIEFTKNQKESNKELKKVLWWALGLIGTAITSITAYGQTLIG